jgi:hypothetical protein
MPTLTFTMNYDGSDAEIMQALGRMAAAFGATNGTPSSKSNGSVPSGPSGWPDKAAPKFAGYVLHAASRGRVSQRTVMHTWLKSKGVADLVDLVKASGVKKSHDFAGVSSSLTRNMLKSGGPKKWYAEHRDATGRRIYQISDELVEPLRVAFHV